MSRYPDFAHCVTALVNVPAAKAFEFLADPLSLGTWSLGCMRTRALAPGGPSARRKRRPRAPYLATPFVTSAAISSFTGIESNCSRFANSALIFSACLALK
jgi:hypothetical protein